jgi:hypothetical protein
MSQSLVPPILNPASLYKEEARRDATRIRIFNMVLTQIHNKIKAIARIPGNEKSLWYLVPEFLPGTPRFDIGEAIVYIVWNLRNTGYEVHYTHPNLLFISWRAYDERYKVAESPWSQVLKTARETVLTTPAPSLISHVTHPQPVTGPTPEIVKRKTPLKKTVEFKPTADLIPTESTNPTIVSAMYSSGPPAPTQLKLPGQLGEKHVSFV